MMFKPKKNSKKDFFFPIAGIDVSYSDFKLIGTPNPQCLTEWKTSCAWWSTSSAPYFDILSPAPFILKSISFLSYTGDVPPNTIHVYGYTNPEDKVEVFYVNDSFCREFLYSDWNGNKLCPTNKSKTYKINSETPYKTYRIFMETNTCFKQGTCCFTCFLLSGFKFTGVVPNKFCLTNIIQMYSFQLLHILNTCLFLLILD